MEAMPCAQCGGGGFAGCEGYARAVVDDPEVPPTLCFPGKQKVAISDYRWCCDSGEEIDLI